MRSERVVLEPNRGAAKVVREQRVAQVGRGEAVVRHQRAAEPHALGVLDVVVVRVAEAEAVRAYAVFLGVCQYFIFELSR